MKAACATSGHVGIARVMNKFRAKGLVDSSPVNGTNQSLPNLTREEQAWGDARLTASLMLRQAGVR